MFVVVSSIDYASCREAMSAHEEPAAAAASPIQSGSTLVAAISSSRVALVHPLAISSMCDHYTRVMAGGCEPRYVATAAVVLPDFLSLPPSLPLSLSLSLFSYLSLSWQASTFRFIKLTIY